MTGTLPDRGVSIIIPSYRTPMLTEAAVRSALGSGAAEVIVVDNASADETIVRLDEIEDERLTVMSNPRNVGFAGAANVGARRATAGHLIFLNSDALIDGDAVAQLIDEIDRLGGRAIAGPRLVGLDSSVERPLTLPTPVEYLTRAIGMRALVRRMVQASREPWSNEHDPVSVEALSGACMAIRRDDFERLGGFDERFFMFFEDLDLCRRARSAGLAIRYVPSAIVHHIGSASSGRRRKPWLARAKRQYFEKWWGRPGAAMVILLLWLRLVVGAITLRHRARRDFDALRAAIGGRSAPRAIEPDGRRAPIDG